MTLESKLKELIEAKSGNVRAFSLEAGIPYTTLRSILERGVLKANIENVFIIAKHLGMKPEQLAKLDEVDDTLSKIIEVSLKLNKERQQSVYYFAEYQLEEQENELKESNVHYLTYYGAVSAGTGEMLQEEHKEEIRYEGELPQHDYTLSINGNSMEPMFQDGEIIFVRKAKEARIGQIVIAIVNGEAYVKKLDKGRLISLNSEYDDIHIGENDRAEIIGVVVL